MARAAAAVAVFAAIISTSCLNIIDVVQPAEVKAGKKFEVVLELRSETLINDEDDSTYVGLLAVSLPEGAEVLKASYEGGAKGKLKRVKAAGPPDLRERPGYTWVYWATPGGYEAAAFGAKDYTVKLKIRAPDTPGNYRLAYAAGAAKGEGPDINLADVVWGGVQDIVLERAITVK